MIFFSAYPPTGPPLIRMQWYCPLTHSTHTMVLVHPLTHSHTMVLAQPPGQSNCNLFSSNTYIGINLISRQQSSTKCICAFFSYKLHKTLILFFIPNYFSFLDSLNNNIILVIFNTTDLIQKKLKINKQNYMYISGVHHYHFNVRTVLALIES